MIEKKAFRNFQGWLKKDKMRYLVAWILSDCFDSFYRLGNDVTDSLRSMAVSVAK